MVATCTVGFAAESHVVSSFHSSDRDGEMGVERLDGGEIALLMEATGFRGCVDKAFVTLNKVRKFYQSEKNKLTSASSHGLSTIVAGSRFLYVKPGDVGVGLVDTGSTIIGALSNAPRKSRQHVSIVIYL